MRFLTPGLLVWTVVADGSLLGEPAAGDWLLTTDGAAVETRGGWEVKGRLVVFHTPAGVLSSMRLDKVDLEASRARTDAARAEAMAERDKPPAEPAPKKKATFILTDAQVGHVDPATLPDPRRRSESDGSPEDADVRAAGAGDGEFSGPEDNPLEVADWSATVGVDADGVVITGVVLNPSEFYATDVVVTVTILDLSGAVIADGRATLEELAIPPGGQTTFEQSFPGIFSVGDASFEMTSFNIVVPEPSDEG